MNLLRNVDGYSYYENPDKELVQKILNYPKPETISDWFTFKNSLEWKIIDTKQNGKHVMESTEGDLMTISFEDYDKLVKKSI